VIVALGRIAFDSYLQLLKTQGAIVRPRPQFGHGSRASLADGTMLLGCYHPSRQNTNTNTLTPSMIDTVFADAARLVAGNDT
jgi:uracil-DNA glycosylase